MIRNNEDRFGPRGSGGDEIENTSESSKQIKFSQKVLEIFPAPNIAHFII